MDLCRGLQLKVTPALGGAGCVPTRRRHQGSTASASTSARSRWSRSSVYGDYCDRSPSRVAILGYLIINLVIIFLCRLAGASMIASAKLRSSRLTISANKQVARLIAVGVGAVGSTTKGGCPIPRDFLSGLWDQRSCAICTATS